ncbi:hypothetical protein C3489_25725 [Streptomyces sp. Ru71]|uniref:hypothetical protein n=1 Tax=Streptomyces sp. Ru71 TaxID=2080746 RepID=UPI000CDDFA42|nr:hypothetical protein [Streptomyces sp. Ru71]POX48975.1 hypothetical protein C3489_25725 [Streptomyces sp. Ru71]
MRASTGRDNRRARQPAGGEPLSRSAGEPLSRRSDAPALLSGPWLLPGHDGRLLAYAHVEGAVLRWTERRPGGPEWSGPDVLPIDDVTHLTIAQGRNRYAHLLGRRVRGSGEGPRTADLVYAIQYQAGRPLSEWRSVGNPLTRQDRSAQLGVPAAAVNTAGALHVFAFRSEGRIALRREDAKGRWEAWTDLKTTAVLDTPVAVATSTGHVEVVAPSRGGTLAWYQREPGAAFERAHDLGVVALPGSATGLETAPGRVTYYLTDVHSRQIVAVRPGEWPIAVGGDPGDGRHAALAATVDGHPCTVLAHRDAGGRIMLGLCPAEGERYGVWWADAGTDCLGDPALACDAFGRVTVLAEAPDGSLVLARQDGTAGLTLGDWTRL